jgi:hypothetical protein
MCSFDGRSGINTGAIPRERNEQAWKDHLNKWWSLDARSGRSISRHPYEWMKGEDGSLLGYTHHGEAEAPRPSSAEPLHLRLERALDLARSSA